MIDYSRVSRGNLTAASIFQDRIVLGNLCLDMNEAQQGQQRLDEMEMEKCQRESYRAGREAEIRKKYVCVVCDYVYEGDELPEDYECPLCAVGPDQFEEVEE